MEKLLWSDLCKFSKTTKADSGALNGNKVKNWAMVRNQIIIEDNTKDGIENKSHPNVKTKIQ